MSRRVIVVGAGPAGLTAAHVLVAAGAKVTVLERAAEPGGRSGTDEVRVGDEVWRFDRGAEFVASFYSATHRLARRVGIGRRELVRMPLDSEIAVDGVRHPLPAGPRAITRTRLLSARSKGRAVRLAARLATRGPSWSRLADSAGLDDRSAADYITRAIGRDYADNILPATLDALTLSPAADTSRVIAMAQLAAAPGASLSAPYGGLAALWAAVAGGLTVRYGVTATAVRREHDTVLVDTAGGDTAEADAVLLAGPASLAVGLLPGDHPDRPLAEAARFSPAVKLHVALAAPVARLKPLCPAGAGRHSLAGIAPLEARHTGQVPHGRGGLEICAAPHLGADLLGEPDRVVRTMLLAEAERLLGGPVGDILGWSVVRLPEGVPRFGVGWLRRLADRPATPDRILPIGDWLDSPSVEGAVRSALRTVPRLNQAP